MATLQEGHSFVTAPLPSSDKMNATTTKTSAGGGGGVGGGNGAPALHRLSQAAATTTAAAAPAAAFTATPNDEHLAPSMMVWTADFFDVEVRGQAL
jgi:hypothetical protein